jgi:outer membrane protein TolC
MNAHNSKFFRHTKLLIFIVILFLSPGTLKSQKIITLKECYERALIKTSLSNEKELYKAIWQLKDNNLSKNWLPALDANASFIYNSEVIDMSGVFASVPIPGLAGAIKPLPHEQYKITFDINQVIYDGGSVKKAKAVEKADLNSNQQQTEVDLYKIRGQVNNYYYSILLTDRQKELLKTYLELIDQRLKSMQTAMINGVILKSDIDVLTSEKIKIEQQISEIDIKRKSLLGVLSDLTGNVIREDASFILPQTAAELSYEISRPELKIYDLRNDQLEAGLGLLETKRMPKAFGFATFGYGNPPGSNFFKNQFAPYYILGAGIKWNIFDWDKTKNDKQQIKIQQGILKNRKTDLSDNLKNSLELKNAEITSLVSMIEKDSELILLRKRIAARAESQYENGIITATDYLNEMNSEREAMINYEIHKIKLILSRIELMNISGKEIE